MSFRALKPVMQERYLVLAVQLEDMPMPLPILQTLWNATEAEARRTCRHFVDRSLAQPGGAHEGIGLHDLQLDYVRAQYPDRPALSLVHGAIRLSSNVFGRDPAQFASQIIGRLLPYHDVPALERFTANVVAGAPTPWIRPLKPALHPPGTSLIRTLEGHSYSVTGVAVSADGRRAVSASWDGTLKVWDLEGGRELHTLEGHSGEVNGVAVSANGRWVVSASPNTTLTVWDMENSEPQREHCTLKGHTGEVNGVAVSANGRWVVSASSDTTLKVWDLEVEWPRSGWWEHRTLEGHSGDVTGAAVSADGRRAVSASSDTTLKVWDLESCCELRTLSGHSGTVTGVALSADGRLAVSASADTTLKVWDLESGRELRTLEGHSGEVNGVALSADGRLAVSASRDKTLRMWDLESGAVLATFTCDAEAYSCAFLDGRKLIAGDAIGRVHFLCLEESKRKN